MESDDDFDPRGNDVTVLNNNARNVTSDAPMGIVAHLEKNYFLLVAIIFVSY